MKKVVIIGAGVSGKIIARGLKDKYRERIKVILVGPEGSEAFPELFYFNQKIPGICEKEVQVTYEVLKDPKCSDELAFQTYQMKSRGTVDSNVKKSSLDLVGKTVTGYLLNQHQRVPMDGVIRNYLTVSHISLDTRTVSMSLPQSPQDLDYGHHELVYDYDYLISTVPLNVLMKLVGTDDEEYLEEFKKSSIPIYQSKVSYKENDARDFTQIRIYYDLHAGSVFYRHSSYFCGEDMIKLVSESINYFNKYSTLLRPGKILPNEKLTEYVEDLSITHPELLLCGRYARWDYHYMADQSYYDAIKFMDKNLQ